MRQRFIIKHRIPSVVRPSATPAKDVVSEAPKSEEPKKKAKNNDTKNDEAMNIEQIEKLASELTPEQTTKKIKKDKGLIERTESSKIMITEDNKQLLTD
jgi:hypothetical protein